MTFSTCPTTIVAAPIEQVWALLASPRRYGEWVDAAVERIDPPGPAAGGQEITGTTSGLGRRWPVRIMVEAVDSPRHQIDLRTTLPLGIVAHNHLVCTPIDAGHCRFKFG